MPLILSWTLKKAQELTVDGSRQTDLLGAGRQVLDDELGRVGVVVGPTFVPGILLDFSSLVLFCNRRD